jgi:hypothetical protein
VQGDDLLYIQINHVLNSHLHAQWTYVIQMHPRRQRMIASVHPVREDIINELLKKRKAEKSIITELVEQGRLIEFMYEGKKFYRKNIQNSN